jgi:c-di-GMP-binding flagellar brake protein YcgR
MFSNNGERRNSLRYDFPQRIDYILSPETSENIYQGVTINISNTGVCLYIFNLLPEGQKITIKNNLPVSYRTALVRWIKKVDDDLYKAGVLFVDTIKNLS